LKARDPWPDAKKRRLKGKRQGGDAGEPEDLEILTSLQRYGTEKKGRKENPSHLARTPNYKSTN